MNKLKLLRAREETDGGRESPIVVGVEAHLDEAGGGGFDFANLIRKAGCGVSGGCSGVKVFCWKSVSF